ncbi:hypothetical protein ACXR2T_10050 [Leucobacter sp. HY1910]
MSNVNRHSAGAKQAGQSVGGQFAASQKTEASGVGLAQGTEQDPIDWDELDEFVQELQHEHDQRGAYLASLRGGEVRTRLPVTMEALATMDEQGTLPRYTQELLDDFNLFTKANADVLKQQPQNGGRPSALFAAIDTTDFLLRVKEDNAVRDPHFLSGEDPRVIEYLNTAIDVTNAPDRETALKRLGAATEYN